MRLNIRTIALAAILVSLPVAMTSCRNAGKVAKAAEKLWKGSGSTVSNTGKLAAGAARAYNQYTNDNTPTTTVSTVTCASCDGLGQVNYFDDYGNYLYTGDCPHCEGSGYFYVADY